MNNTIILLKGYEKLTRSEYKDFSKYDTINGDCSSPEEIKRWSIEDKEEALEELAKYRCSYQEEEQLYIVTEYALEYCETDEDGDYVEGSDYDYAKDEE